MIIKYHQCDCLPKDTGNYRQGQHIRWRSLQPGFHPVEHRLKICIPRLGCRRQMAMYQSHLSSFWWWNTHICSWCLPMLAFSMDNYKIVKVKTTRSSIHIAGSSRNPMRSTHSCNTHYIQTCSPGKPEGPESFQLSFVASRVFSCFPPTDLSGQSSDETNY